MIKMENNKLEMEGQADDLLYEIEEIMRGFIGCFKDEKKQKAVAKLLLDSVLFALIPDIQLREHMAMEGISELLKQAKEDE